MIGSLYTRLSASRQRPRLLVAIGLWVVALSLAWLLKDGRGGEFVRQWAYPAILFLFLLWGLSLVPAIVAGFRRGRFRLARLAWPLGTVLVGGWILFAQANFGPKILMDEYLLSSTARNMHEYREVFVSTRVTAVGEEVRPSETFIDKRPWFYPFLVSLLHDLRGVDLNHSFVLNAFLGVLFLLLAYGQGTQLGGPRAGGVAVLLWASLPLLAQSATGGGIDLLNLCMIQGVLLFGIAYLRDPSESNERALVLTGVLLAYTRYESVIFMVPLALVVLIGFLRSERACFSWVTYLVPLLLFPLFVHLAVQSGNAEGYEMVAEVEKPFSLTHLAAHLPHAVLYFFDPGHGLSNSPVLSVLGTIGLISLIVRFRYLADKYLRDPDRLAYLVFIPALALHLILLLSYHAGELDNLFASRFALPFHLALVSGALLFAVDCLAGVRHRWWAMAGLAVSGILAFTMPANAKAIFSNKSFAVREQGWLADLRDGRLGSDSLIIDRFTVPWSLEDWVALRPEDAILAGDVIRRNLANGVHADAYIVERNLFKDGGFEPQRPEFHRLHEMFETELVFERSFRPLTMTRVYRIRATDEGN